MSIYSLFNNLYDPLPLFGRPSVYVISDSELAKYKQEQTKAEILELERLIDGHKTSIERLETTVNKSRDSLALPEADQPEAA